MKSKKKEYLIAIKAAMKRTDDISLLDLIYKLLIKSAKEAEK